jgi:hypothetical protein
MQILQRLKFVQVTAPVAINDNTAYTTNTIDTLGYDELPDRDRVRCDGHRGRRPQAAGVGRLGMSGAADITGADFSVSPATLPSATDDNHFYGIHVKLGGPRKRYMDLSFTAGDGAAERSHRSTHPRQGRDRAELGDDPRLHAASDRLVNGHAYRTHAADEETVPPPVHS